MRCAPRRFIADLRASRSGRPSGCLRQAVSHLAKARRGPARIAIALQAGRSPARRMISAQPAGHRCSITQRPIHRQQEGFADGFDTVFAPGPGLVGGELDFFAVGGEGFDLGGDLLQGGGGFVFLGGAGGVGGSAFGERFGQRSDGTAGAGFDAGEGIGGWGVVFAGTQAFQNAGGKGGDVFGAFVAEGGADAVGFAHGLLIAFVFAPGGGLDGSQGGEDAFAIGIVLAGFDFIGGACADEVAKVLFHFSSEGSDGTGEGGIQINLGQAGSVGGISSGGGDFTGIGDFVEESLVDEAAGAFGLVCGRGRWGGCGCVWHIGGVG